MLKSFVKKIIKHVRPYDNVVYQQNPNQKLIFYFTVVASVILSIILFELQPAQITCRKNVLENEALDCRFVCRKGQFILRGMKECHPWLTCEDLSKDFVVKSLLTEGAVKKVHLAEWKGQTVIMSELRDVQFQADFDRNLQTLQLFSPSQFVVQLVGFCNSTTVITEYHPLGDARNCQRVLEKLTTPSNALFFRLGLCASYVSILEFFHNYPNGARVMCDSSTLLKTLSQYLLTDDMQLVANDLDALPEVKSGAGGITCGHRELSGDFVAPEQRWPYKYRVFNSSEMPPYDEKTDIWKVPDVCDWFLGTSRDADIARFRVFDVHRRCKSVSPTMRPTATEIFSVYRNLMSELEN